MILKTKEEVVNQVETYLNKTANHLFVTESGHLYKVLPLRKDGKLYCVTITMGKGQVVLNISEAVSDYVYQNCGNGTANVIKNNLFPEYYKAKSIPNFRKMRKLVEEIIPNIKFENNANKELTEKIKERLPEFEVVK